MHPASPPAELVIITGLSGSGKGTVLKCFEDMGYYAVDNLPLDLFPKFAELTRDAARIRQSALVVDVREGQRVTRIQNIYDGEGNQIGRIEDGIEWAPVDEIIDQERGLPFLPKCTKRADLAVGLAGAECLFVRAS